MAKTILTVIIFIYSLCRISFGTYILITSLESLPMAIYIVTFACCACGIYLFVLMLIKKLRITTLKRTVVLFACVALVNMIILRLSYIDDISTICMVFCGTLFDVLFAIGCLTLPIKNKDSHPFSNESADENAVMKRYDRRRMAIEQELVERGSNVDDSDDEISLERDIAESEINTEYTKNADVSSGLSWEIISD